jgi:thioredoxin reductase (NADPH)
MHDLIIIGGGIAAFTAALFSSRRGLSVLVIAKDIGGQANFTDLIENYPGIHATGGFELISKVRKQAEDHGAEVVSAEVSKIKRLEDSFILTAYGQQYKSKVLILAFGKTPQDLGVVGEEQFKGRGVSYCSDCDAPLFKNKVVTVAGIGDISIAAAIHCAKYAKKVYVLSKTDKLIGHPGLVKNLLHKKNVELVPFVQINEIFGANKVEGLKLKDLKTGKEKNLPTNGLFVELGYVVKSEFVKDLVELDEQGQIIVRFDQSTSCPGVFAAGDATNRLYKQAVISAGEGATAALAAYDHLMHLQGGHGLTSDWTQIKKVK